MIRIHHARPTQSAAPELFSGSSYFQHAQWQPRGAMFEIELKYTPKPEDMGVQVNILGNLVVYKRADDTLAFEYSTDDASPIVISGAGALAAGTQYAVKITSNGNGVTLDIDGSTTASSAIPAISSVVIEYWFGPTQIGHGEIQDVKYTDLYDYQDFDGERHISAAGGGDYIITPRVLFSGDFIIEGETRVSSAGVSRGLADITNRQATVFTDINTSGFRFFVYNEINQLLQPVVTIPDFQRGQLYKYRIHRVGTSINCYLDERLVGTINHPTAADIGYGSLYRRNGGYAQQGDLMTLRSEDLVTGETHDWRDTTVNAGGSAIDKVIFNSGNAQLGPELVTEAVHLNPNVNNGWVYNGNGEWELNGNGTNQVLKLIANSVQQDNPRTFTVSFEVVSISGVLTATNGLSDYIADAPGFYTFHNVGGGNNAYNQQFKRLTGTLNCVIRNISFRRGVTAAVVNFDPVNNVELVPNNTRSYVLDYESSAHDDLLDGGIENRATIVYT